MHLILFLSTRLLPAVLIASSIAFTGQAVAEGSEPWGDFTSGDLHWGESLSAGGFRLEVADFTREGASKPIVLLNLFKGGDLAQRRTLSKGENFTFQDEILVAVDDISIPDRSSSEDLPTATVRLGLYAAPEIVLHVTSDKDSYEPGDEIRIGLTAENQGTQDAEGLRISLSSSPALVEHNYSIGELKSGVALALADSGEKTALILYAPFIRDRRQFDVRARARFSDRSNKDHQSEGYCSFLVSGQLIIHKRVQETMRLGMIYPVVLTLRNPGKEAIHAEISDDLPGEFEAVSPLDWEVDVGPGKTEVVSYEVRPGKSASELVIPAATARYELGGESFKSWSESLSVDLTGPSLEVEKSLSSTSVRPGEEITVSVDVINEGNQTVKASLNETVPGFARLVGGKTRLDQLLGPGEKASLGYSISCDRPGTYQVPGSTVYYSDAMGYAHSAESQSMPLEVHEDSPQVKVAAPLAENVSLANATYQDALPAMNDGSHIDSKPGPESVIVPSFTWALYAAVLVLIYILIGKIL